MNDKHETEQTETSVDEKPSDLGVTPAEEPEFKVTVRKLNEVVRPRGVLAE